MSAFWSRPPHLHNPSSSWKSTSCFFSWLKSFCWVNSFCTSWIQSFSAFTISNGVKVTELVVVDCLKRKRLVALITYAVTRKSFLRPLYSLQDIKPPMWRVEVTAATNEWVSSFLNSSPHSLGISWLSLSLGMCALRSQSGPCNHNLLWCSWSGSIPRDGRSTRLSVPEQWNQCSGGTVLLTWFTLLWTKDFHSLLRSLIQYSATS